MNTTATPNAPVSMLIAAVRGIAGIVVGLFIGGMVNMSIIIGGGALLPPPEGVDVNDIVSINAHIGEYSVVQLMVPWLAHAMGTLVGAFLAAMIAATPRWKMAGALVIGAMFLLGGSIAVSMIPDAPLWFDVSDLGAYVPMALLGAFLARQLTTCCARAK